MKETTYNSINSSMMTPNDPRDVKKLEKTVNSLDLKFVQLSEKVEDLSE